MNLTFFAKTIAILAIILFLTGLLNTWFWYRECKRLEARQSLATPSTYDDATLRYLKSRQGSQLQEQ